MGAPQPEARWTRRRFLATAGALTLGAIPLGALVYEAGQGGSGSAGAASASPTPLVAGNGLAAGRATPAPSPSAEPGSGRLHFRSRPDLTPPIVSVTATGAPLEPGYIFLTPDNGAGTDGPTIVDGDGELVWLRPDSGRAAADFAVATYRGDPVLTWWEGTLNGGIGSGEFVLADASYRELTRIRAAGGRTADLHELRITRAGTALLLADAVRPASQALGGAAAGPPVMDCAVQEIDIATGELLFEWHAADHIAVDESVIPAPTQAGAAYDYVHANSIDVDRDGSLLVSARNTSALYKVDRASGTIVWRLGGRRSDFAMGDGTVFGLQHDARRQADGTITLFDDGADGVPSRGIVLRVDEAARSVTLEREYRRPGAGHSGSQGNVDVLADGNVFVGWGSQPFFSEFDPSGKLVYDASFPSARQSYRDHRQPWTGQPTDAPAIAAELAGRGWTRVFASWNGATEVSRWDVLAGRSSARLSVVGSSLRLGFETAVAVATGEPLVAVRAVDASGVVLGTSAAVRAGS